jgi:hypothetical protein
VVDREAHDCQVRKPAVELKKENDHGRVVGSSDPDPCQECGGEGTRATVPADLQHRDLVRLARLEVEPGRAHPGALLSSAERGLGLRVVLGATL